MASVVLDQRISTEEQRTRINVEVGHVVPAHRLSVGASHRAEHDAHRVCNQKVDGCLQQGSTRMDTSKQPGPFKPACNLCAAQPRCHMKHVQAAPPSRLDLSLPSICSRGPAQNPLNRPLPGRHGAPQSPNRGGRT